MYALAIKFSHVQMSHNDIVQSVPECHIFFVLPEIPGDYSQIQWSTNQVSVMWIDKSCADADYRHIPKMTNRGETLITNKKL